MNKFNSPTRLYRTTFTHLYFSNGFVVSKELTQDGKEYRPQSTHACMQHGFWCEQQIKEEGEVAVIRYLKSKKIKNPRTIIKAIQKL